MHCRDKQCIHGFSRDTTEEDVWPGDRALVNMVINLQIP
jgi:hypothetical protein